MDLMGKISSFFAPMEEEIIFEDDGRIEATPEVSSFVAVEGQKAVGAEEVTMAAAPNPAAEAALRRQNMRLVSTNKSQEMRIQIYVPQNFDNVSEIADALKSKRSAIVNYERVDLPEQRRICDFLNGVCYVQDGEVRRITSTMVLYVPAGVEIDEARSVAPEPMTAQI